MPRNHRSCRRPTCPAIGLWCTVWIAVLGGGPAFANAPVAYNAEYRLKAYGVRAVLRVAQHRHDEADTSETEGAIWRYRTELKGKGLGKLFLQGTTFEDVLFEVLDDGRLRPVRAVGEDTMKDRARDVTFTWSDARSPAVLRAEGVDDDETFSMELPPEVLDRAMLIPAMTLDLDDRGDSTADSREAELQLTSAALDPERGYVFRVLERGRLRQYYTRLLGTETVEGPDGEALDTVVVEQQRDGSSRITTYWLAPALDYLPLQMQQRRDDRKPHMRASLKHYEPHP